MFQGLSYAIESVVPFAVQTGLFDSLFTALEPPAAQGPTGNIVGDWTPVLGLIEIACMAPPPLVARIQATTVMDLPQETAKTFEHVLLAGWYPQLRDGIAKGWRCTVDGTEYRMLGAESGSQFQTTRVHVALIQVGGQP